MAIPFPFSLFMRNKRDRKSKNEKKAASKQTKEMEKMMIRKEVRVEVVSFGACAGGVLDWGREPVESLW